MFQGTVPQRHPRGQESSGTDVLHKRESHVRARFTVRLKPLCGHWNHTQRLTGKVRGAESLVQAKPHVRGCTLEEEMLSKVSLRVDEAAGCSWLTPKMEARAVQTPVGATSPSPSHSLMTKAQRR